MELSQFKQNLVNLNTSLQVKKEKYEFIQNEIDKLKNSIKSLDDRNNDLNKAIASLSVISNNKRNKAKEHFEKIVTNALQFITQDDTYEFVIKELPNRQKPSYEFYIKSVIDGNEVLRKPEDSSGGGFIDIISTALKYAYLEIFNDPKTTCSTLIYDEPGKMISKDMSVKFAEYIKFLGKTYNKQTIMISHNENLINVADKVFNIQKDSNGISQVQDIKALDTDIMMQVTELLDANL